jgi:hypothetical protein
MAGMLHADQRVGRNRDQHLAEGSAVAGARKVAGVGSPVWRGRGISTGGRCHRLFAESRPVECAPDAA